MLERSYNEKQSALTYACKHWNFEAIAALLDAGANPRSTPFCQVDFPLFCALYQNNYMLADVLLNRGAMFTPREEIHSQRKEMALIVSSALSDNYGVSGKEVAWVKSNLSGLIPLIPIEEKAAFYQGNAQGGHLFTFLQTLLRDDNIDRLKRYEPLGVDCRLSAEEVCVAIDSKSGRSLRYLLAQNGPETWLQVVGVICEEYPSFSSSPST